jgi:hypothetical protein
MIRNKQILTLFILAGSALVGAAMAQAQPGGQGGFNNGPGGPGGMPGMNQRADFRNLTPEQRQEMQDKLRDLTRELSLRAMLENAGITDKATQDTVLAFAAAQEQAVQALREKNRDLQGSLYDNATANAQIIALQNDYTAAAEDESDRRGKALALLDQKINYSKQPRLKAVLTVLGLVGDAFALTDSNSTNGGGIMGGPGMGGPGGGFGGLGGGFGGPGGQGGPGGRGGQGGQRNGGNQQGGQGGPRQQ